MPTTEQAKKWYQGVDAIHDFSHIERVYRMAERLARSEGADLEIVHAAALLHDSRGTMPGSGERAEHHIASAVFAGEVLAEEGWPQERIAAVQHCIRAHRFRDKRERPETIEARVLFDADKLDVLGAVGVMRTIGYAVLAGQPAYVQPSQFFLATGQKEPGEPHSAYHEYLFKLCKIKDVLFTEAARAMAEERDAYLADFFVRFAAESRGEM
ncbi:MAG: HD domain-containing protein [Anaerolineaceae bacterium]|nr:HD domain-containing protein [Anaerolineaceae bacterium]